MIVRKILEYTEECTSEKYILIADKYDEGWELDREEMEKLVDLIERCIENERIQQPMFKNPGTMLLSGSTVSFDKDLFDTLTGESVLAPFTKTVEDQAEECPEYIEPPAESEPIISKSMGADIQEPEDIPEPTPIPKAVRQDERDYSPYIRLYVNGIERKDITREMIKDWGVTAGTATSYYYSKVKPEGELQIAKEKERAMEKEKKSLAAHLDKKIQVIPTKTYDKPSGDKYFSDEDRERIQKELGLK